MAYIANKPVRFDRTYAIGEVIPAEVIDPKMTRRLLDMGRILCVDLPAPGSTEEPPVSGQEAAQNGAEDEGGTDTQEEEETPAEAAEGGAGDEEKAEPDGEFICPQCGKAFGSQNALSAHSRSHKE